MELVLLSRFLPPLEFDKPPIIISHTKAALQNRPAAGNVNFLTRKDAAPLPACALFHRLVQLPGTCLSQVLSATIHGLRAGKHKHMQLAATCSTVGLKGASGTPTTLAAPAWPASYGMLRCGHRGHAHHRQTPARRPDLTWPGTLSVAAIHDGMLPGCWTMDRRRAGGFTDWWLLLPHHDSAIRRAGRAAIGSQRASRSPPELSNRGDGVVTCSAWSDWKIQSWLVSWLLPSTLAQPRSRDPWTCCLTRPPLRATPPRARSATPPPRTTSPAWPAALELSDAMLAK